MFFLERKSAYKRPWQTDSSFSPWHRNSPPLSLSLSSSIQFPNRYFAQLCSALELALAPSHRLIPSGLSRSRSLPSLSPLPLLFLPPALRSYTHAVDVAVVVVAVVHPRLFASAPNGVCLNTLYFKYLFIILETPYVKKNRIRTIQNALDSVLVSPPSLLYRFSPSFFL